MEGPIELVGNFLVIQVRSVFRTKIYFYMFLLLHCLNSITSVTNGSFVRMVVSVPSKRSFLANQPQKLQPCVKWLTEYTLGPRFPITWLDQLYLIGGEVTAA